MKSSVLCGTACVVLAGPTLAFSGLPSSLVSSYSQSKPTGGAFGRFLTYPSKHCLRTLARARRMLSMSAGSSLAPPKTPKATDRGGGGGEEGLRLLTPEESESALQVFQEEAKRSRQNQAEYDEYMEVLERMRAWGLGLSKKKKMGCKRLIIGNFARGKLCCIVAAEVLWSGAALRSRDVRISLSLMVFNPRHNRKTVGFETLDALKDFGMQNALLLDLAPLMSVPSLRMFSLASTGTLDKDPETLFQVRCC
ncbi:unnamed protein product [Discosporangium mesarthrocarpum]